MFGVSLLNGNKISSPLAYYHSIFLFLGSLKLAELILEVSALLLLLRKRVEKLEDWLLALLKYSDRFSLFGYVLILYGQAASI